MPWVNENTFDSMIDAAIARHGNLVSRNLVKAMIAVESGFKPTAYRAEPHINDASRGLMQVLYATARGTGWIGTEQSLYDPATNIGVGVDFLSSLVKAKRGDLWSAVSAYNNGNGKRATGATTVCLARDTSGKCVKSFTAQPGQFLNQPYVDKVQAALSYFDGSNASGSGGTSGGALLLLVGAFLAARKTLGF